MEMPYKMDLGSRVIPRAEWATKVRTLRSESRKLVSPQGADADASTLLSASKTGVASGMAVVKQLSRRLSGVFQTPEAQGAPQDKGNSSTQPAAGVAISTLPDGTNADQLDRKFSENSFDGRSGQS